MAQKNIGYVPQHIIKLKRQKQKIKNNNLYNYIEEYHIFN